MYRDIIAELSKWKESKIRKPLMLMGARSVGKSWIIKDFGAGFFNSTIIIDFEKQDYSRYLFEGVLDKNRILKMLNIFSGDKVNTEDTLIVLENIHLLNEPFKLMEFLYLTMSEYYICCTTFFREQLLFKNKNGIDYCEIYNLYPLSFGEFLIVNKEFSLYSKIENHKDNPLNINDLSVIEDYLKIFYCVGGMPSVVNTWLKDQSYLDAQESKKMILCKFEDDFNKIDSKTLRNKVFEVWNSIGAQLEKDNKKFQFGIVKITARSREYSEALEWLYNRRYISKLFKIKDAKVPINKQIDDKSFEVFMIDIGLLSSDYQINYEDIMGDRRNMSSNNNALNEQFAFQELLFNKNINDFYYWTSDATARIEFVFEDSGQIVPIDINIDGNKKAQSLKVFKERYNNAMSVRITYEKFSMNNGILNIPIYAIWNL